MVDITQVVVALIGLMSAIITTVVVPYLKTKLDAEKQQKVLTWVQIGVSAAEQLSKTGVIQKKDRKQYVLDLLAKHGMTADIDLIEAMLEGAVYDLPAKVTAAELKELTANEVKKTTEAILGATEDKAK